MPKLYEYMGMRIFFYSNEHEPVHVHARYQGKESKIIFEILDGKIVDLREEKVKGKPALPTSQMKDFKHLVTSFADEIVLQWVNYFVYKKSIKAKIIEGRIK